MSEPRAHPPAGQSLAGQPFAGQTIAVMGLGRAGLPAARALAGWGARVLAWDDREPSRAEAARAGITLADLAAADFAGIDALLLSPGIPHRLPRPHPVAARALGAGVPVLSEIEFLFRADPGAQFVGITGTNGKSTTTALVGHLLATAGRKVAVGGNLGPPALALPRQGAGGAYVLEMSSYALERLARTRFDVAIFLNLTPDHLDRHGDMAGYMAAKRHIFDNQDARASAIVGVDDEWGRALAEALAAGPAPLVCVSARGAVPRGVFALDTRLIDATGTSPREIADLADHPALPGAHNRQNAAAAAAAALACGLDHGAIRAGLAGFPGLPHRQERVAERAGMLFVNDSKATNADAADKALGCYERLHWIAGGLAKEGGIAPLALHFPRIAHAYLIGEAAPDFARTLAAAGVAHTIAGTLDRAVALATEAAQAEARARGRAVVLLSPACASFDQFASFEARGDAFRALVTQFLDRLPGSAPGSAPAAPPGRAPAAGGAPASTPLRERAA
ncbi:MAG: UDP-N-acetylmuramoyl-L-alanine--D-glutamate ligase [Alphaproteobacteria bacterium]|nr:UDP-N-acetylmuramoyl-L-alanine--D-glutamate ligase [Alphaproteobacteria bacterium]